MNFFENLKGYTKLDNYENKDYINTFDTMEDIVNYLDYNYSNNLPSFINKKIDIQNENNKFGIYVSYNNHLSYISYDLFFLINNELNKKIKKFNFKLFNTFFNLYFIKFYFTNKDNYNKDSKYYLINNSNAIFGIYHTFNDKLTNTVSNLYYSTNLGIFILKGVLDKNEYLYGKLFKYIEYDKLNHLLVYDDIKQNCPLTFYQIKGNKYGIKKLIKYLPSLINKIDIGKDVYKPVSNKNIDYFNESIKITLDINIPINIKILKECFIYLISTVSSLRDYNIKCVNDTKIKLSDYPDIDFLLNRDETCMKLNLLISNRLVSYTELLIKVIYYFFSKQKFPKIKIKKEKFQIHLISELYFLIFMIIINYYIRRYTNKDSSDDDDMDFESNNWDTMRLCFTEDEIEILNKQKPEIFENLGNYLLAILLKTISIKEKNVFTIVNKEDSMDVIYINKKLSNTELTERLNKSKKANKTRNMLLSMLSNNKNDESLPIFRINMIESFYFKCRESKILNSKHNIPVKILVIYNDNSLEIIITNKRKYKEIQKTIYDCFKLLCQTVSEVEINN